MIWQFSRYLYALMEYELWIYTHTFCRYDKLLRNIIIMGWFQQSRIWHLLFQYTFTKRVPKGIECYEMKYRYIFIHCDLFDIFKCGKNKNPYSFMGYFGNPSYIFPVRELIKVYIWSGGIHSVQNLASQSAKKAIYIIMAMP